MASNCYSTQAMFILFSNVSTFCRVLTWEDGYYDNCGQQDSLENKCSSESLENFHGGRYSHDPLGLAVAKMSYHVYSLGEGYDSIYGIQVLVGVQKFVF